MHPEERYGHKTGHPGAYDSTERVTGISVAHAAAHHLWSVRHNLTHQWKGAAHAQGRRQNHYKGFHKGEPERCPPVGVTKACPPGVETVKQVSQDGNGEQPIDADAHL